MTITNNNFPIIDLPAWEILQPLPTASAIGVSMCNDKRGTNRFIYLLISATSFWRYDAYANTYQQLANPPGGTVGAGTVLIFDPSRGTAGYVWALISSGTGAPTWQYYDCAANTWTARSVTNLPATFGTDAALAHTCSTYNGAGNDDYIYLVGNNASVFYRFSITGNSWINTLTAVTTAPGTGCGLIWMPGWNTDRIVCIRGAATATVYYYSVTGNNWTAITFIPATETFTTGSMVASKGMDDDKIYIQKDITLRIYCMDLTDLTTIPHVTEYLLATGATHVGDRLLYIKESNGIEFLYMGLHTSVNFMRTPIYF